LTSRSRFADGFVSAKKLAFEVAFLTPEVLPEDAAARSRRLTQRGAGL
jgi:hypothetical protein